MYKLILQFWKRDQQIIFDKFRTPNIPHVIKTFTDEFIISRTDIKEQEKISEFFRNIDNLITLHQRKLEHLQMQKKGLLQQMFV